MGWMAWGRTASATIAVTAALLLTAPAFPQTATQGGPTPSPPGAKVEFIDIKDGAVLIARDIASGVRLDKGRSIFPYTPGLGVQLLQPLP